MRGHGGPPLKSLDSDENSKPKHTLFCHHIKICRDLRTFWKSSVKRSVFWVKNRVSWALLHGIIRKLIKTSKCRSFSEIGLKLLHRSWYRVKVLSYHLYCISYCAKFANLQLRICRENSKYALDESFYGHFCPRRKAANFCHPDYISQYITVLYEIR